MMEYLLKVSFVIGIALLFYKIVLHQESFFSTNRLYLVGCIVLAFVLPFVMLPQVVSQQGYLASLFEQERQPEIREASSTPAVAMPAISAGEAPVPAVDETVQQHEVSALPGQNPAGVVEKADVPEAPLFSWSTDWLFLLAMLYGFGVAIFTINLLVQVGSILYKAISSTDKIQEGDYVIVNTESRQAPCSFFQYICLVLHVLFNLFFVEPHERVKPEDDDRNLSN